MQSHIINFQENENYRKINGAKGGRPLKPILNDDGYSIKGCKFIYAPKGQALEYSELATNPYRGCGHKCAYCYVPNVIRMDRKAFDSGAVLRSGYLEGLRKDAKKYQHLNIKSQIMFSFTTDPYHPFDTSATRESIEILKDHGLSFCTLTKGGARSLRDVDLFDRSTDAFATTLTSLDSDFSKKWESGAATPQDRIDAIIKFKERGVFTWVSLEPTLNINESLKIIKETKEFVDLFKIGRANYLPMTKTTDWEAYTHEAIEYCQKHNIKHYIKKDLQKYLPSGYENALRINQHSA